MDGFEGIERNKVVCTSFERNALELHVIPLFFNFALFVPSKYMIIFWNVSFLESKDKTTNGLSVIQVYTD